MDRNSTSGHTGTLKVAVKIGDKPHLSVLDFNRAMDDVVRDLCKEHEVLYRKGELGLWSDKTLSNEDSKYVTDENKHKVASGSILCLKPSPTSLAENLFLGIKKRSVDLKKLVEESDDGEVLRILHIFNAHLEMYEFLDSQLDPTVWVLGLQFIYKLCMKHFIKRLPKAIVTRLFHCLKPKSVEAVHEREQLIVISLNVLSALRRYGRLRYDDGIFDDLAALLMHQSHPHVQESALELLTFLVLFPNNEEEERQATKKVVNQKIVGCICEHILRYSTTPSQPMQQQLYRYQTLVLRPYWYKKVTKVLNTDKAMKVTRKLTQRAKEGELPTRRRRMGSLDEIAFTTPQPREKATFFHNLKSSFRIVGAHPKVAITSKAKDNLNKGTTSLKAKESKSNENKISNLMCFSPSNKEVTIDDIYFRFYGPIHYTPPPSELTLKKASSISTINSAVDENTNEVRKDPALSTRSTSELTLSCLNYQAKNYAEHHQKWALTKKEDYPFAEQITKVVCTVLEIGRPRPPDDLGETFNPLVFYAYPYVLEELFCEAYILYNRTSKEMKAKTNSDIPKVLTVVQDQLNYALHPYFLEGVKNKRMGKPTSLEQMRENLLRINYKKIEEKRKEDRMDRMKQDLKHKPLFVDYRESRKSDILELIKKQRLQFAQEGEHFLKVNHKGDILKDQTTFLSVNKKQGKLITGECWESPKRCNHSGFVPIEDVVDVSMGKQSKYYKDIFQHNENWIMKAPTNAPEHWNWLMSLKMKDNSYINFCARNLKSAHYWVDAIHIMLGKSMGSITMSEELNEILDLEVQLHFLDIEMLPIPDVPPVIPPLPSNFDFFLKEKRRNKTGVINLRRTP